LPSSFAGDGRAAAAFFGKARRVWVDDAMPPDKDLWAAAAGPPAAQAQIWRNCDFTAAKQMLR
jgi:hypothetical protein